MQHIFILTLCIEFISVLVHGDDSRSRRGMSMLRMGKRDMSFLRMGRAYAELPPLVPDSYDLPSDNLDERDVEENMSYDLPRVQLQRVPPFPRLGYEEDYLNAIRRELDDETRQVYMNQPRMGRYVTRERRDTQSAEAAAAAGQDEVSESLTSDNTHHQSKRALPRYGVRDTHTLPRLGLYERNTPFPRLGLYERAFPRLGVRDEESEGRSVAMPRLGMRELEENMLMENERALPRFGLRDTDYLDDVSEKRAMGMLRMGKRDSGEDKRAMGMLRMGRSMGMLRMGKRAGMSMLRMGRATPEDVQDEPQKRAMGMLRMGRSFDSDTAEKRAARAMPLGMRSARGMSMLRMGRSSEPALADLDKDEAMASEDKRAPSLSRSGRGMSMLRMGKRSAEQLDGEASKRDMGQLRMGKREADQQS